MTAREELDALAAAALLRAWHARCRAGEPAR